MSFKILICNALLFTTKQYIFTRVISWCQRIPRFLCFCLFCSLSQCPSPCSISFSYTITPPLPAILSCLLPLSRSLPFSLSPWFETLPIPLFFFLFFCLTFFCSLALSIFFSFSFSLSLSLSLTSYPPLSLLLSLSASLPFSLSLSLSLSLSPAAIHSLSPSVPPFTLFFFSSLLFSFRRLSLASNHHIDNSILPLSRHSPLAIVYRNCQFLFANRPSYSSFRIIIRLRYLAVSPFRVHQFFPLITHHSTIVFRHSSLVLSIVIVIRKESFCTRLFPPPKSVNHQSKIVTAKDVTIFTHHTSTYLQGAGSRVHSLECMPSGLLSLWCSCPNITAGRTCLGVPGSAFRQ